MPTQYEGRAGHCSGQMSRHAVKCKIIRSNSQKKKIAHGYPFGIDLFIYKYFSKEEKKKEASRGIQSTLLGKQSGVTTFGRSYFWMPRFAPK